MALLLVAAVLLAFARRGVKVKLTKGTLLGLSHQGAVSCLLCCTRYLIRSDEVFKIAVRNDVRHLPQFV